ncbi:MAG: glutamate-5-semialdehyde dehydrogenase [Clostridia bacterium]|nr:glutamate-5-semialdehyde dehydrogenase [Clostridia bacterium]
MFDISNLCAAARAASRILATASTAEKNAALHKAADALIADTDKILSANKTDVENALRAGMPTVMCDRLRLDAGRVRAMADACRDISALPDPVGSGSSVITRPNGLVIEKIRTPLGVVGMICESRPNVAADAASICLKSGNACILRGGKDAIATNRVTAAALRRGFEEAGLPADAFQLVDDITRDSATAMMNAVGGIDVLIPRGGRGLIRSVVENARVPYIETGSGNCHVYVDSGADMEMALRILHNAKCSRPSVCNACESLVVARDMAEEFLPLAFRALQDHNVEFRGCPETCAILPEAIPATEEDHYTEYNDYILSVKVVSGLDEAIAHINAHSTHHSEAIVTRDYARARRFQQLVDSAAVYVNASTRFTDGGEFGLGAEMGISTQKLHVRGPFALEALTCEKTVISGNGQIR